MSDTTEATILLAEEHDATRAFLQDNLTADGYRVLVAAGRAKGLALLTTSHPDLIVLDINGRRSSCSTPSGPVRASPTERIRIRR
jgi:DNA-binding response OmpR family regulator